MMVSYVSFFYNIFRIIYDFLKESNFNMVEKNVLRGVFLIIIFLDWFMERFLKVEL